MIKIAMKATKIAACISLILSAFCVYEADWNVNQTANLTVDEPTMTQGSTALQYQAVIKQ